MRHPHFAFVNFMQNNFFTFATKNSPGERKSDEESDTLSKRCAPRNI